MNSEQSLVSNRSYLYGDGLFETVRVQNEGPRFLNYHRQRFTGSARALGFDDASIDAGCEALESLKGRRDGLWRVTVARAEPNQKGGAQAAITVHHRPFPYGDHERPRLMTMPNFYFPHFELAEHKTTSWLRCLEARRRAKLAGFDEALLVSPDGRIGEAAAANIFLRIADEWVTPPVQGILPGVVRQVLIDGSREASIPIAIRPLFIGDLHQSEAVVLTSTARLVAVAESLNGQDLPDTNGLADELKALL